MPQEKQKLTKRDLADIETDEV